jgi:uncharacterized damage-inducible protein DinB
VVTRIPWEERRFTFTAPAGFYAEVIERLRGTPARLEERVRGVPTHVLVRRHEGHWSIQENVGHLLDLEALWFGRVDDYEHGLATLRAADIKNRATTEANHNHGDIAAILAAFRRAREAGVARLDALDPAMFERTALHPRLRIEMRLVDALDFQADHDDYHLATITEQLRRPDSGVRE